MFFEERVRTGPNGEVAGELNGHFGEEDAEERGKGFELCSFDAVVRSRDSVDVRKWGGGFGSVVGLAYGDLSFARVIAAFSESSVEKRSRRFIVQKMQDLRRGAQFGTPGTVVIFDELRFVVTLGKIFGEIFGNLPACRFDQILRHQLREDYVAVAAELGGPSGRIF